MKRNRTRTMLKIAKELIFIEILMLVIQFVIGMWMNLFATFPTSTYPSTMFGMMGAMFLMPELIAHMMLGILILLISLVIFIMLMIEGDYVSSVLSAIAFISIAVAAIAGMEFVFSGFSNNVFSFMMALGFIFSVMAYFLIFYHTDTAHLKNGVVSKN